MLGAIVGIELPIRVLAGKWKVSQNRSAADRAGVAAGLATLGGDEATAHGRGGRCAGREPPVPERRSGGRRGFARLRLRCTALLAVATFLPASGADGPGAPLRGLDGAARARLHRLPRPAGPQRPRWLLPTHRRQAGGLPARAAAALPQRPAPLRADDAAAGAPGRRLPARDRARTSPRSTCPIRHPPSRSGSIRSGWRAVGSS